MVNVAGKADTCNTHFLFLIQWDEKIDRDMLHASGRRAEYKGFLEGTGYSRVHKPGSLSSVLRTHRGRENLLDRVVPCPSACAAARTRLRSHTHMHPTYTAVMNLLLRFSVLICSHQNGLNAKKELASLLHVNYTKQTSIRRAGSSNQTLCCLPPPQISSAGWLASASQMRKLRLSLH